MGATDVHWPRADYSRVPYEVFLDPSYHALEQERIFRGSTWLYLGLEAELPRPGDYKATVAGDTPVVVARADDGSLHAFVNRCAHRGTLLVRAQFGNTKDFTCVYHHWCYDQRGNLIGVPFLRGLKGRGGMPRDFKMDEHGLRTLVVESFAGVIFATFDPSVEPLESYLDAPMCDYLKRMFRKPITILGYSRQRIPANWKLYYENGQDAYHAGLLHQMSATFGLFRSTEVGGIAIDKHARHKVIHSIHGSDDAKESKREYNKVGYMEGSLRLNDPSVFDYRDEIGDRRATNLMRLFPNSIFQQLSNSLATRQVRPRSHKEFEIFWTYFGYADDDADLQLRRLKQANIVGAAGFSSMEDSEACRLVQVGIRGSERAQSVVEMGGLGPIVEQNTTVTEVLVRGFWRYYCNIMGIPVSGAQLQTEAAAE